MRKLYLYAIFHLNIYYSSIAEERRKSVIDTCYWPILDLAETSGIPLGLEISGGSLEVVERLDPAWVMKFKRLLHKGRCELVGSGYMQIIGPLAPLEVNEWNQKLGVETYMGILGLKPMVALVNEQAYSSGLVALYKNAGYRAIAMEWNNPYKYHPEWNREWRYYPQYAVDRCGNRIPLIWNNVIGFQKFQRYAHGEIGIDEYMAHLESNIGRHGRSFSLYGNDAEIFDFRPGRFVTEGRVCREGEWKRIRMLFERLKADRRFKIIAPSEVLRHPERPGGLHPLRLESPEQPIPVKKQEKYNLCRWAVSGRDNAKVNASCYEIYFNLLAQETRAGSDGHARSFSLSRALKERWRSLVYLWASDFRTSITDVRYACFQKRLTKAASEGFESFRVNASRPSRPEITLVNQHRERWDAEPFEIRLEFGRGGFFRKPTALLDGIPVATQIEEPAFYGDGSLKSARLVICPTIEPLRQCRLSLEESREPIGCRFLKTRREDFDTEAIRLSLLSSKGAAISALVFKGISSKSLFGTIPHGYFDDIALAADYFSGHTIIFGPSGRQITDLNPARIEIPARAEDVPVRVPVRCTVPLAIGEVTKIYCLYRAVPRVDIEYLFRLKTLKNIVFRLGMVTVNPGAFEKASLRYSTVNGGHDVEEFRLRGSAVKHHEAVSPSVSSKHCIGATERWVSVGDARKGLLIVSRNGSCAPVPMVHYQESGGRYFLRVYNSIGELDDTTRTTWRGEVRVGFSYVGYLGTATRHARHTAAHISRGLGVK